MSRREPLSQEAVGDLFKRLSERQYDPNECFLCAAPNIEGSAEHVVPRWLQRRFKLWDQELTLLNGTSIPYRNLTIPCCSLCNQFRLKPIEDSMLAASESGVSSVRGLPQKTVFVWLGKILFGILYRELFLSADRSHPGSPQIILPSDLRGSLSHQFFLQQTDDRVVLENFNPGTVFTFMMQPLKIERIQWDFIDDVDSLFVGCRFGRIAMAGCLADGGALEGYAHHFKQYYDLPLHPLQFSEICAQVCYLSKTRTRVPKYMSLSSDARDEVRIHQMPLLGLSAKPLFDEWDARQYALFLSACTGAPFDAIFVPPDKVTTWLHHPNGALRFMSFEEFPVLRETPSR